MRRDHFEIFRGRDGLWYWRFRAKNGRITADGSEGYKRRDGAEKAIKRDAERHRRAIASADGIFYLEDRRDAGHHE